jgi:hypothetical protein
MLTRISTPLRPRRFLRSETGAASIPAVMMLPVFLTIMFSSVELGVMILRQTLFERGVDLSVRILRLGIEPMPSHDLLKKSICNNIAFIPNCTQNLAIDIFEVDKADWTSSGSGRSATCTDKTLADPPDVVLQRGQSNQLMLLRACLKAYPMMPGVGFGAALRKDAAGQFAMVTTTAFVNEPRANNVASSSSGGGS